MCCNVLLYCCDVLRGCLVFAFIFRVRFFVGGRRPTTQYRYMILHIAYYDYPV